MIDERKEKTSHDDLEDGKITAAAAVQRERECDPVEMETTVEWRESCMVVVVPLLQPPPPLPTSPAKIQLFLESRKLEWSWQLQQQQQILPLLPGQRFLQRRQSAQVTRFSESNPILINPNAETRKQEEEDEHLPWWF